MPVTQVGGVATLQKAVILDSLGYSDEAKKLYQKCQGHAVPSVWWGGGHEAVAEGQWHTVASVCVWGAAGNCSRRPVARRIKCI